MFCEATSFNRTSVIGRFTASWTCTRCSTPPRPSTRTARWDTSKRHSHGLDVQRSLVVQPGPGLAASCTWTGCSKTRAEPSRTSAGRRYVGGAFEDTLCEATVRRHSRHAPRRPRRRPSSPTTPPSPRPSSTRLHRGAAPGRRFGPRALPLLVDSSRTVPLSSHSLMLTVSSACNLHLSEAAAFASPGPSSRTAGAAHGVSQPPAAQVRKYHTNHITPKKKKAKAASIAPTTPAREQAPPRARRRTAREGALSATARGSFALDRYKRGAADSRPRPRAAPTAAPPQPQPSGRGRSASRGTRPRLARPRRRATARDVSEAAAPRSPSVDGVGVDESGRRATTGLDLSTSFFGRRSRGDRPGVERREPAAPLVARRRE